MDSEPGYDNVDLTSVNFEKASLNNLSFRGARLTGANLDGANLSGSDFTGADLRGARMRRVSAFGAKFEDAVMDGVDAAGAMLSYGYLTRASLCDANLEGAQFEEASCTGARFDRSNLTGCFIYGGSFAEVSFKDSTLIEARIINADLTRADLSGANLLNARMGGLTLTDAIFLNTRLPTGELYPPPDIPDDEIERQLVASIPELRTLMTAGVAMLRHERDGLARDRDQAATLFASVADSSVARDRAILKRLLPKRAGQLTEPAVLNRLAWGLKTAYASQSDRAPLRELEQLLTEALALTPPDRNGRQDLAGTLASLREERGRESSDHASTDTALDELDATLATVSHDSPAFAVLSERAADAFHDRGVRQRRRQDFDRAIELRRTLLESLPESASLRPTVLLGLGRSLAHRRAYQPDVADLREAIEVFAEGARLAARFDPPRHADCTHALGHACVLLYSSTGVVADLEKGIVTLEQAISELAPADVRGPRFLGDLASALRLRTRQTDLEGGLVKAIAMLEEAIREVPATAVSLRGGLLQNLGTALADRYARRGDLSDLDRAIEVTEEAAGVDDEEHGARLSNLGSYLHLRYQRTGKVANLSRAIDVADAALQMAGLNQSDRIVRLVNLGTCLVARHARAGILDDLTRAIDIFREVRTLLPSTAPEWPTVLTNLGSCLATRYRLTQVASDLEECLALIRDVESTPGLLQAHRQRVLLLRAMVGTVMAPGAAAADPDAITAAFREACQSALESAPDTARRAGRVWGEWAARRHAWDEAAEAFHYALKAAEFLSRTHTANDEGDSNAGTLAAEAAYALAKVGEYEQAVIAVERGRAIQLASVLEREHALERLNAIGFTDLAAQYTTAASRVGQLEARDQGLGSDMVTGDAYWRARAQALESLADVVERIRAVSGFERFDRDPEFADVSRAASHRTLVYVCATDWGGLALIVDRTKAAYPVWLPVLTSEQVSTRVSHHLANMRSTRLDALVERFDDLAVWLWSAAMQPVLRRVTSHREIALIATGRLAFLPFHAAWYSDTATRDRRHYAIDDVGISYAPNARVLERAHRTSATRTFERALVVEDPRPVRGEPLPFAAAESAAAARVCESGVDHLSREQATREAVLRQIPHRSLLHFACHGISLPDRPLDSGVIMSGDDVLTVRDVLSSELSARLVVLSACETAQPQDRLTDELAGMPGAFLQAGATGVVGSLWRVHDESTANLMTRFYEHLRESPQSPAHAFRRAQLEMAHASAACYWSAFVYIGA